MVFMVYTMKEDLGIFMVYTIQGVPKKTGILVQWAIEGTRIGLKTKDWKIQEISYPMNTKTHTFCVKMAEKNEVKDASPPYKIGKF